MKFNNLLPKFLTRGTEKPLEKRDSLEMQGVGLNNLAAINSFLSGGNSAGNASNEYISDATAVSISDFFACLRILSDSVAASPCLIYKQTDSGGKKLDTDNPLHHLLSCEPNEETSAFNFFSALVIHMHTAGNGYVEIQRDGADRVVALWNLDPKLTEPVRLQDGKLAYRTQDGMQAGQESQWRIIPSRNMIHVTLFSWNGVVGQSIVGILREQLGLSLSQQKYTARVLVNSAIPSVALTLDGVLAPEDKTRAREDWERLQSGSNTRRIAILDQGMKLETLGMSNADAELLSSRVFSRSAIAAAMKVPVYTLGATENLTNGNAEQLALSFIQQSLQPIFKRIEHELKRKLLPAGMGYHIEFSLQDLLKADIQSTMNALSVGRQNGFISANDARRQLGHDSIGPQGDTYSIQVNMMNLERLLDAPEPTEPTPAVDEQLPATEEVKTDGN